MDFLSRLNHTINPSEIIEIDFSPLEQITPIGLVALVATIRRWQKCGHTVTVCGLESCAITGYLQRMDVLSACGISRPEQFQRHPPSGRFVPVKEITADVDRMGGELALCLAPGGDDGENPMADLYDLAWYILTEIANNVRQHSRGTGFVAAQLYPKRGLVRLAIADNGIGILKSFENCAWAAGLNDAAAIKKALESKISSKGSPTNEGVGLTLVAGLVQIIKGKMIIVSECGVAVKNPNAELISYEISTPYAGTLLGMTFSVGYIKYFSQLLQEAKINAGLLQSGTNDIKFIQ